MTKIQKVYDAADGSATPGRVFTSSIGVEQLIPAGNKLDFLMLGWKGAVSTAAVPIEDAVENLSAFTLYVGSSTRINMSLRQLCALMLAYYGQLPFIWENTDGTGNDFIGGVKIPVYAPVEASKPHTIACDRKAVSNIGTETLAIDAYYDTGEKSDGPVHAVKIDHTTAGSAGVEQIDPRIAPVGKLKKLILQQENPFADGNIDVSVQRMWIKANGERIAHINSLASHYKWAGRSVGVLDPMDDLMNVFTIVDLGPDGIDAKGQELTLEIDVQDISNNITIIPVVEIV